MTLETMVNTHTHTHITPIHIHMHASNGFLFSIQHMYERIAVKNTMVVKQLTHLVLEHFSHSDSIRRVLGVFTFEHTESQGIRQFYRSVKSGRMGHGKTPKQQYSTQMIPLMRN